jgi:transposase
MARRSGYQASTRSQRADHWRALIAAWPRSGLTQRAYCEQERVSVNTFAWWKHRLAENNSHRPAAARFMAVQVRDAPDDASKDSHPAIEIILLNGIHVRLGSSCNEQFLTRVLETLQSQGC